MSLSEDYRRYLEDELDKCDAALRDKPFLNSVYNEEWRQRLRAKLLGVENENQVTYPCTYAIPHFGSYFPADYQYRLEEGARAIMRALSKAEQDHLVTRLREGNPLSAEEEMLLARGFGIEFGNTSLCRPNLPTNDARPEFAVNVAGQQLFVEAKGFLDPASVRTLNEVMIEYGQSGWVSFDPKIDDPIRLRNAARDKMLKANPDYPYILVLTQHSAWPSVNQAVYTLREAVLSPAVLQVPDDHQPLVLAYVADHTVQGIWANPAVAARRCITSVLCKRITQAILTAFYPRSDGILFTEKMNDLEHVNAVRKLEGWPPLPPSTQLDSASGMN